MRGSLVILKWKQKQQQHLPLQAVTGKMSAPGYFSAKQEKRIALLRLCKMLQLISGGLKKGSACSMYLKPICK